MPATLEIRRRIRSVKNIGQITKAMELVSASKMRRAQETAMAGRQYTSVLNQMLGRLLTKADLSAYPLLHQPDKNGLPASTLVVVFGPDKGLCGGLIANLGREIAKLRLERPNAEFVTMGKRTRDVVIRLKGTVIADFPLVERPRLNDIFGLAQLVQDEFTQGHHDEVLVANTQFVNTLQQRPRIHQLLPLSPGLVQQSDNSIIEQESDLVNPLEFIIEPSLGQVVTQLLPRFVEMTLFQALLEAQASEHSARMIAMKNAGDNARDLQDELTLAYNQMRQASITAELAEIASASMV